jgi:hypothetical protein
MYTPRLRATVTFTTGWEVTQSFTVCSWTVSAADKNRLVSVLYSLPALYAGAHEREKLSFKAAFSVSSNFPCTI